jgi:hypothetical protein
VGLCNWPTKTGRMHAGFKGENKIRHWSTCAMPAAWM